MRYSKLYNPSKVIIIGIILGIIVVLNIAIILYFRSNPKLKTGHYKNIGKLLTDIKKPWQKEEDNIKKLSSMVKSLQNDDETK